MPAIKPMLLDSDALPEHHVTRVWVGHSSAVTNDPTNWTDILTLNITVDEPGSLLVLSCMDVARDSSSLQPTSYMRLRLNINTSPEYRVGAWSKIGVMHNNFVSHMWDVNTGAHVVALQVQRMASFTRTRIGHRSLVAVLLKR